MPLLYCGGSLNVSGIYIDLQILQLTYKFSVCKPLYPPITMTFLRSANSLIVFLISLETSALESYENTLVVPVQFLMK